MVVIFTIFITKILRLLLEKESPENFVIIFKKRQNVPGTLRVANRVQERQHLKKPPNTFPRDKQSSLKTSEQSNLF